MAILGAYIRAGTTGVSKHFLKILMWRNEMGQIKDLDFRALILAFFFAETVEFPRLGWVSKVAICGKKNRDKDLSHNIT